MSDAAVASMASLEPESARLDDQLPSLKDLQTAEQMKLLDKVDQLRAHGLNEITALPQLIVCGDQSSGKSSVLEAISGVPFPRKDSLCTRFATELILRRAPSESMSVSITPGQDRKIFEREQLINFQHRLTSKDDFPLLFEKAKEVMGLGEDGKSFSKDILRVEIYGPQQPQLTLVDLPGFIHWAKNGQGSDIALVNDLITSYLENPRSIILAVVSAKSDTNTQIILAKVEKIDPQGKRTLGIITKPDKLAPNTESENGYIALARNDVVRFQLGWHVVRNLDLTTENAQEQNRDQLEAAFFKNSNFKTLPSKSVGIEALRSRLSQVLFNQIRIELPRLLEEIESKIKKVKITRDQLGLGRPKLLDQKQFLLSTSQRFLLICENAVKGYYDHEFFHCGTEPERRLCASLMNKHFKFAEILLERGARYRILGDKDDDTKDEGDASSDDTTERSENPADNLYEGVRKRTRDEAIQLACEKLKLSRGRELPGLPNPFLVGDLFREYSQPWEGLAREHIKDVWDTTNKFLDLVFEYLVGPDVTEKIQRFWLGPIMDEKLVAANAKLDELLEVHKDEPMTTNHHFVDNRKELQQRKFKDDLKEILEGRLTKPNQKISLEDIPQIISMVTPDVNPDMDMVAAEDAFDNMNAYYKVAIKLFTDNVPTLAIQGPIVRQVPTTFQPSDVDMMSAELVEKIASESEDKTHLREETLRTLTKLEEGARICKDNIPRSRKFYHTEESKTTLHPRKETPVPERGQTLSPAARSRSREPSPGLANTASSFALDRPQGSPFSSMKLASSTPSASTSSLFSSSTIINPGSFGTAGPSSTTSLFSNVKPTSTKPGTGFGTGFGTPESGTSAFGTSASSTKATPSGFGLFNRPESTFGTSESSTLFGFGSFNRPESSKKEEPVSEDRIGIPTSTPPLARYKPKFSKAFKPCVIPSDLQFRAPHRGFYDRFQNVCTMERVGDFSFEELRLADSLGAHFSTLDRKAWKKALGYT